MTTHDHTNTNTNSTTTGGHSNEQGEQGLQGKAGLLHEYILHSVDTRRSFRFSHGGNYVQHQRCQHQFIRVRLSQASGCDSVSDERFVVEIPLASGRFQTFGFVTNMNPQYLGIDTARELWKILVAKGWIVGWDQWVVSS